MESSTLIDLINALVGWLNAHPHLASALIFFTAFGESLVIIGLFIFGTPMMLGFGVLISLGALELWSTLFWAFLGSVLGDCLSFTIGYRYRESLHTIWPFSHHPEWLNNAERFLQRNGAKSVLFGRFIGAVRSIIPVVCGMMNMPIRRFVIADIISSLLWAPSHILPGVLLGASLTVLADVGTRLLLLFVLVISVIWASVWLVRRFYRLVLPLVTHLLARFLIWSEKHPIWQKLTSGILDPNHPHIIALLELSLLLLVATWLFFLLLANQFFGETPLLMDGRVYYQFKGLRIPLADYFFVFLHEINSVIHTLLILCVAVIWLVWRQRWQALAYWSLIITCGIATTWLLYQTVPTTAPTLHVNADNPVIIGSQITFSTIIYGFLAVIVAREANPNMRWIPYSLASAWIAGGFIAHLYLGLQWFSDALLGLSLGLFWLALFGLAYRRHVPLTLTQHCGSYGLVGSIFVTQIVLALWLLKDDYQNHLADYALQRPHYQLTMAEWQRQEWQDLAIRQLDYGDHRAPPLTLQFAGDLSQLKQHLMGRGWRTPSPLSGRGMLEWLSDDADITVTPVLPQSHDSQNESLRLVYVIGAIPTEEKPMTDTVQALSTWEAPSTATGLLVLRVWSADTTLLSQDGTTQPIWVASITCLHIEASLGLLNLLQTGLNYDNALALFRRFIPSWQQQLKQRSSNLNTAEDEDWTGHVLLLTPPSP